METCWACGKTFTTSQGRKAHQKTCKKYRAHRAEQAALGTARLRQAVPQADATKSTSTSRPTAPDPFAQLLDQLRNNGVPHTTTNSTNQTPTQRRRALLQEVKATVIDQYWYSPFPITAQMKVDARSHIDRELRHEPLEEWSLSEISELAACLRDRIYLSAHREAEEAAKQTLEEQRRDLNEVKRQTERTKRKDQWIDEALRRLATQIRIHSISALIALQAMCDIKAQLGMTLTGAESLPDAYAAIDAVIQSRVAEWKLDKEVREQRKQERWIEGAAGVGLLIGCCYLYVYSPQIFKYLFDLLFSTSHKDAPPTSSPQDFSAARSKEETMFSDPAYGSPYENPEEYSYP